MAKIVVGTDGSPSAQHAVSWALGEARLRKAALHIVHAWMVPLVDALPEPWLLAVPIGHTEQELEDRLAAGAREFLEATVAEAKAAGPELDVIGELAEMRPAAALLAAARDADLLVVGSRGHGGFAGLLLGSVSSQCVHHAPCPVVVVPAERADG
ncbi:MAG TPA: universal stress protein [Gaiellaceae bacterium]|nr:universal stress protein [Gaiellaceae bacterium]